MIGVRYLPVGVSRPSLCRVAGFLGVVCAFAATLVSNDSAWPQDLGNRVHALVLFSNDAFLPANQIVSDSIHATVEAGAPGHIEFFPEYLDLVRFPAPEHEARMVDYLQGKYAKTRFDLVFAVGPQALNFEIKHRDALGLDVPLIFTGVRDSTLLTMQLPPNAAGIASRMDPLATLELALRLQPETRTLAVVTGASTFDK